MLLKKYLCVSFLGIILFLRCLYAAESDNNTVRKIYIKDIKVSGNNVVSVFDILENILIKPQEYTVNNFNELLDQSIKILYSTNRFKNIQFKIEGKDTETVYLEVEEFPLFEDFEFQGINNIKSNKDDTAYIEKLSEFVDFMRGDFVSDKRLHQISEKIRQYFVNEGYYFARVTTHLIKKNPQKNYVTVIFEIFEDAEVKVKYIDIYSKEHLNKLKKMIIKYKATIDKGDVFKPQDFEVDINRLRVKYMNDGYMNIKIHYDLIPYKKENKLGIKIYLEIGKKVYVRDFKITGNKNFETDKLLKSIKLEKDKFFSYDGLMDSIRGITDIYAEEGYIETRVEPMQKFLSDTEVVFEFQITEGNKIYIEDIIITGNYKTQQKVISREIIVKPGEVLNSKKVDLSRRNLVMLNYFEKVDVRILEGKNAVNKILEFVVEEGRTGTLSFGAGYSSIDKFVGFLEVSKNNFDATDFWSFTGKGQKLNLRIEYGKSRKNYELGWSDPWFNDNVNDTTKPSPAKPLFLGYNLYRVTRNPDDYELQRTGGSIKVGRKFGYYDKVFLKYQFEEVRIFDVDPVNAPTDIWNEVKDLPGNKKRELQSSFTIEYNRNTTDSPRWPTKGYIFNFTNEIAGGFVGGDVEYLKDEIDLSIFIPGFKTKLGQQVIALHGAAGTVDNIFSNKDVPSYTKYFLGGSNTVRGYSERSIKFVERDSSWNIISYGGLSNMYFNLEYRIPLVKDTISNVIFFDGGNIFKTSASFSTIDWRYGYGFGFRITTPMGDLRLDWARRISDTYPGARDKGRTEIHFNIGNMF